MDCQIHQTGSVAEVVVIGSLDSSWAPYLADRLDEVIRDGIKEVRVDMAGITYLSSNGIALLVRYHKQMRQIGGRFRIVDESEEACRVLELTGLARMFFPEGTAAEGPTTGTVSVSGEALDRAGMTLRVLKPASSAAAGGILARMGDPTKLTRAGYGAADEQSWSATPDTVALGLGALGPDFAACRDRYGEFLAVAGVAAYQPGAASVRPDFELATGAFVPEVRVLYGLSFGIGAAAGLVRFEMTREPESQPVPLSALARACLEESGADTVGLVLVGETAGLVGAALRRSPVEVPAGVDPFAPSEARDWLSMTPEPEHARSTALVVGVATRRASSALAPFVRPLATSHPSDRLRGHFHAAAVPFRPLPRGRFELTATVHQLFEPGRVETVLHLLNDTRPIVGAGESMFRRGVFWFVPLEQNP
jgi:anti-anti-sigma factor